MNRQNHPDHVTLMFSFLSADLPRVFVSKTVLQQQPPAITTKKKPTRNFLALTYAQN